jgi:hypothetical protein
VQLCGEKEGDLLLSIGALGDWHMTQDPWAQPASTQTHSTG